MVGVWFIGLLLAFVLMYLGSCTCLFFWVVCCRLLVVLFLITLISLFEFLIWYLSCGLIVLMFELVV